MWHPLRVVEERIVDDDSLVLTRHKLHADDYYRMAAAGILTDDDRVEPIDGEIIDMAPIGQDHVGTVNRVTEALFLAFVGRAIVSTHNPIRLDDLSEPQPDFAVLRRRADFYTTGTRPGPADVLLLIEVSDSSLRFDRSVKLPLYARAGIPEVWIVDLQHGVVDVHRTPRDGRYEDAATMRMSDILSPSLAPDVRIGLDQVFG
jgi:Uma2 family endonuclease